MYLKIKITANTYEADDTCVYSGSVSKRTPPPEPTARRKQTREKLLDAAYETFTEVGFQAAAVALVCERAGFTRGAFYSNFASKDELFAALLAREYNRRADTLRGITARAAALLHASPERLTQERAAEFITEFFGAITNDPNWYALELELLLHHFRGAGGEGTVQDFLGQFRMELTELITELVVAAGRRFVIPAARVITALTGLRERAFRTALVNGGMAPEATADLGESIAELLFALTTEVPHA